MRTSWFKVIVLAVGLMGLTSHIAFGQDGCGDTCNAPETFCTSTQCYDGRLRTTCLQYDTHYGGNPYICTEPPSGQGEIRYPDDGIDWETTPEGSYVGDCYGNCGAGCGDSFNPCGGPTQYWELTVLDTPVYESRNFTHCLDQCRRTTFR